MTKPTGLPLSVSHGGLNWPKLRTRQLVALARVLLDALSEERLPLLWDDAAELRPMLRSIHAELADRGCVEGGLMQGLSDYLADQ
jgi:hypothetical protein